MSRHLVYIQQIRPDSFLHFSYHQKTGAFCLRCYPNPDTVLEVMRQRNPAHPDWLAPNIIDMAHQHGNYFITPEQRPDVNNTEFWHNCIHQLNRQYGIAGEPRATLDELQAELQKVRAKLAQCKNSQKDALRTFAKDLLQAYRDLRNKLSD